MKDQLDIVIEQNKPLPTQSSGRKVKYPYKEMKPGESFFVTKGVSTHFWELVTGFKFSRRKVTENGVHGWRVWRIEGPNDTEDPRCV